jgi:hypothetical protein
VLNAGAASSPQGIPADLLARYRLIANDPWEFCVRCVYTKDEVDKAIPTKKFPAHYEYLKLFTRIWQREPKIVVPKSRRMFMTWHCISLHLHDAMFGINRFNVFQSKKEEDSDALVQRAKFILENIPNDVLPRELIPEWKYTYGKITFPEIGSQIMAFAQGADQLRQYTVSRLLLDEFAFWDKAEESYSAAAPTLEGGGSLTILSSAAPGFMKRLVEDELDAGMVTEEAEALF